MTYRLSRHAFALVAVIAVAATVVVASPGARAQTAPYLDPGQPISVRVDDLLSRMTLDEKIGQMTQVDIAAIDNPSDLASYRIGSVLAGGGSDPAAGNSASAWTELYDSLQRATLAAPLGIPMIFGTDAVHGHSNVVGATIFPHNIGLGAARNPSLVEDIGRATALEVAATGVDWTFAPTIAVVRNDRWGRAYESFGETPELVSSMTRVVSGLQGSSLSDPATILATAKHYVGDGGTTGGVDQGDTQLSESELRAIHLAPYRAAVEAGVGSVMISYSSWNGVKMHGHQYLITDVLKGELGFDGIVVSDWAGIDQLDGVRGISASDVRTSINAGIDMVMVPNDYALFISLLRTEVNNGRVSTARIDDANRRILRKKFELGLFERPYADRTLASVVGSQEHRDLARQAVRESIVLLKNQNEILPLPKTGLKLFVAGKNADNIGNQCGGWTIEWQGASGNITSGTTILQGIRNAVGSQNVTYNATGTGIDSSYTAAIAVVGETPYAEGIGDLPSSMGLDSTDLATINRLRASGVPVIVVLVSGRPLDIASELGNWDALLSAWLPGTEGAGVADVLFGDYNPTGKLPVTWMQSASQQPINDGDGKTPLFSYGFGLSYGSQPTTTTTRPTTTTTTTRPTTTTTTTRPTTTTTSGPTTTTTTRPTTTTTGGSGLSCSVTRLDQWGSGYVAYVRVTNNGAPVSGWSVPLTFNQSTTVTNAWNANLSGSGSSWTASNNSWNGNLGTGSSVDFGFQGTSSGTITVSCGGSPTTTQVTTTTTRPTTTTTTTRPTTTTTTTRPTTTTTTTRPTTTTTTTRPTTTTTGSGGVSCSVRLDQWGSGYVAYVTVTNGGSSAVSSWSTRVGLNQSTTVTNAWNANVSVSGSTVTGSNVSWNGYLGVGQSVTYGFQGTSSGTVTATCS